MSLTALLTGSAKVLSREYMGFTIFPADLNSSGIRYYSRTGEGITLRADTLPNIKWMIRDYLREQRLSKRGN